MNSSKVYCRPSCPLPHTSESNHFFFDTPQQAELQGFHPCKHCHPGRLKNDLSVEILDNINTGAINDRGVSGLATSLHISERHLRRLVKARTGTSPLGLNKARRLGAAKRLVLQTKLPIIDVAFKVGFSSLRQFNAVFKDTFKVSPREMRKLH